MSRHRHTISSGSKAGPLGVELRPLAQGGAELGEQVLLECQRRLEEGRSDSNLGFEVGACDEGMQQVRLSRSARSLDDHDARLLKAGAVRIFAEAISVDDL